jgi:integrase/recombinase XerC
VRHVRKFLDGLSVAASTRRTYLARLRAFLAWAKKAALLRHDPTADVETPKVGKRAPRFLSVAEVARLIEAIEADAEHKRSGRVKQASLKEGEVVWLSDVVTFAVSTGFRRAEICNLRWSGVNLSDGMVIVETTPDFRSKSGHERRVPVSGQALAVLARRAERRDASGYVFHSPPGGPSTPPT